MASQALKAPRLHLSAPHFTLKPSKQNCYIMAGLIGAGLVGGVGLYVWQSGEIAKLQGQVKAKEDQVASGEKIAHRLVSSETDYADMQSQLRFLESSVTEGEYVPTLLRQMEDLAKSMNLQAQGSDRIPHTLEPNWNCTRVSFDPPVFLGQLAFINYLGERAN